MSGVLFTIAAAGALVAAMSTLAVRGERDGDRLTDTYVVVTTLLSLDEDGWLLKRIQLTARNPDTSPSFITVRLRYGVFSQPPNGSDGPQGAFCVLPGDECASVFTLAPGARGTVRLTLATADGRHRRRKVPVPVVPFERRLQPDARRGVRASKAH